MLQIYVGRHGQNKDNREGVLNGHRDEPLTDVGEWQACELANFIRELEISFDTVYTSPLVRAKRTAEIVCEVLKRNPPEIMGLLIERDFGIMTGKLAKDIKRLCPNDIVETGTITYFLSPHGAETFPELLDRAEHALSDIRTKHNSGSVLLLTHGDFGKMLYASYYKLPWGKVLTDFHFGNCELLRLSEESNPENAHIVRITQHNH